MNRIFETNDLKDNFASLSDKEINKLRKQARTNQVNAEELNIIAEEIGEKIGRPIRLRSNYPADMLQPDTLSKNLDPLLLCQEIEESLTKSSSTPLLHQHKRTDTLYKALYKWQKFKEKTEPFIKPISYSIISKVPTPINNSKRNGTRSSLALNNKDLCVAVQDRLIRSNREAHSLLTPELVEPLEKVLDVSLIKVLVVRDVMFFFFEWSDPMPFVFGMAFALYYTDKEAEKFSRHTVVTLHRKNLIDLEDDDDFDDVARDDKEEAEQLKKKKAAAEEKKKNRNLSIEMDEDDEAPIGPMTPETIKYMNSEDIEQEHVLRSFIECVRQSSISYLTSVYVKRD